MAEQHQVQTAHTQFAQGRQYDPLARISFAKARPGVVKQAVMPGPYQHRQPLSHVQLPDLGVPLGQVLSWWKHHQQHHWPPQYT
ncbi:hypothetical protein D3C78_1312370 [compost metagenome]